MMKLRTLIAAALLSLAVVGSLTAAAEPVELNRAGLDSSQQVAGVCYIYFAGRWWAVPC